MSGTERGIKKSKVNTAWVLPPPCCQPGGMMHVVDVMGAQVDIRESSLTVEISVRSPQTVTSK